jgi:hypothetical protein
LERFRHVALACERAHKYPVAALSQRRQSNELETGAHRSCELGPSDPKARSCVASERAQVVDGHDA